MFNVTVIKLKDIIKYISLVLIIYMASKILFDLSNNKTQNKEDKTNKLIEFVLSSESNILKKTIKKQEDKKKQENLEEKFWDTSIENILKIGKENNNEKKEEIAQNNEPNEIKETEKKEQENENTQSNETVENKEIKVASNTEVVTKNPIKESFNKEYRGVKIKNETDFELTEEILNPDNLNFNKKNIIIFHTHTCESYTQSEKYKYEESRKL